MTGLIRKMDRTSLKFIKRIPSFDEFLPAYKFKRPSSSLGLVASDDEFNRLSQAIVENDGEFVLFMSLRNDYNKKGTILSIVPKNDDIDVFGDNLEIVADPPHSRLAIYGTINGQTISMASTIQSMQDQTSWRHFALVISRTEINVYDGCDHADTFQLTEPLDRIFNSNSHSLHLAAGYRKARDYRVRNMY